MNSNLEIKKENKYCKIKLLKNDILIFINLDEFNDIELFIILYSYIKFKYFIIKRILFVTKENDLEIFRDISIIQNFSYIDFKIWWTRKNNLSHHLLDTKLTFGYEFVFSNFRIELIENSKEYVEKKIGEIEKLSPKSPLKRKKIMQEIVGDLGEIFKNNQNE